MKKKLAGIGLFLGKLFAPTEITNYQAIQLELSAYEGKLRFARESDDQLNVAREAYIGSDQDNKLYGVFQQKLKASIKLNQARNEAENNLLRKIQKHALVLWNA